LIAQSADNGRIFCVEIADSDAFEKHQNRMSVCRF
jgi:hypothetical protein